MRKNMSALLGLSLVLVVFSSIVSHISFAICWEVRKVFASIELCWTHKTIIWAIEVRCCVHTDLRRLISRLPEKSTFSPGWRFQVWSTWRVVLIRISLVDLLTNVWISVKIFFEIAFKMVNIKYLVKLLYSYRVHQHNIGIGPVPFSRIYPFPWNYHLFP